MPGEQRASGAPIFEFRIDESPFSASHTSNWVARLGGLPPYVRGVTRGLMRSGHSFRDALQIAIGVMHTWAHGGPTWGRKSHATPATMAKAAKAVAEWEDLKARAHAGGGNRGDQWLIDFFAEEMAVAGSSVEASFRDGVGEWGSGGPPAFDKSGAGNLLPVGPSKGKVAEIHAKQTKGPHFPIGENRERCEACGKPFSAPVHHVPAGRDEGDRYEVPAKQPGTNLRYLAGQHPFRRSTVENTDQTHCIDCGQLEGAQIHQYLQSVVSHEDPKAEVVANVPSGQGAIYASSATPTTRSAEPGQPIPPIPRQARLIGSSVRRESHGASVRHYTEAAGPLERALSEHYKEQGKATVNRVTGKRGKQMLKRAAQAATRVPPTGTTTAKPATFTGAAIAPTSATAPLAVGAAGSAITAASLAAGAITAPALATALGTTVGALAVALGFGDVMVLAVALAAGTITLEHLKTAFPEKVQVNSASVETEEAEPAEAPNVNPAAIYDERHWSDKTASLLEPHLNMAANLAITEARRQLGVSDTVDDTAARGAVQYAMSRSAARVGQDLAKATTHKLAAELQQGVANGEDKDAIGDRVNRIFAQRSNEHAKLVAATSAHSAYNEAQSVYAAHLPEGLVGGRAWIAHHDEKTRHTHRMADGQERPLNLPYQVGGVPMRYPGDEVAPLHEWINCRCSQAWLKPGESFGKVADQAEAYVKAFAPPPHAVSAVKVQASSLGV